MHAQSLTAAQPRAVCLRRAPAAKPTLLRAAAPRTAHRVRAVPTSAAPEAAAPAAAAERLYEAQLDKPIGVKFVRARVFLDMPPAYSSDAAGHRRAGMTAARTSSRSPTTRAMTSSRLGTRLWKSGAQMRRTRNRAAADAPSSASFGPEVWKAENYGQGTRHVCSSYAPAQRRGGAAARQRHGAHRSLRATSRELALLLPRGTRSPPLRPALRASKAHGRAPSRARSFGSRRTRSTAPPGLRETRLASPTVMYAIKTRSGGVYLKMKAMNGAGRRGASRWAARGGLGLRLLSAFGCGSRRGRPSPARPAHPHMPRRAARAPLNPHPSPPLAAVCRRLHTASRVLASRPALILLILAAGDLSAFEKTDNTQFQKARPPTRRVPRRSR